eukprot:CAMPEP_0175273438 /NCGR_PEP_ID=MMETSP0093-20121207/46947_1 /TAXON_ID=311494 /ORGANISM="Alexandrium monilatum, Strain CCMP3105" /LENGTH=68 /DNA_ID=CAMNT_0016568271 /DNA_START=85 /DNA_END=292 /DNA_ORIENTATION=+
MTDAEDGADPEQQDAGLVARACEVAKARASGAGGVKVSPACGVVTQGHVRMPMLAPTRRAPTRRGQRN